MGIYVTGTMKTMNGKIERFANTYTDIYTWSIRNGNFNIFYYDEEGNAQLAKYKLTDDIEIYHINGLGVK